MIVDPDGRSLAHILSEKFLCRHIISFGGQSVQLTQWFRRYWSEVIGPLTCYTLEFEWRWLLIFWFRRIHWFIYHGKREFGVFFMTMTCRSLQGILLLPILLVFMMTAVISLLRTMLMFSLLFVVASASAPTLFLLLFALSQSWRGGLLFLSLPTIKQIIFRISI